MVQKRGHKGGELEPTVLGCLSYRDEKKKNVDITFGTVVCHSRSPDSLCSYEERKSHNRSWTRDLVTVYKIRKQFVVG